MTFEARNSDPASRSQLQGVLVAGRHRAENPLSLRSDGPEPKDPDLPTKRPDGRAIGQSAKGGMPFDTPARM